MMEISLGYWNELAQHTILITALLSGFSIAVVVSLIVYDSKSRFVNYTLKAAVIAAGSFLVSLFAWSKVLMMTTEEYPFTLVESDLLLPRIIGVIALFLGILSLSVFISLLGWIKSKKMGLFTTVVGLLTFLMIVLLEL